MNSPWLPHPLQQPKQLQQLQQKRRPWQLQPMSATTINTNTIYLGDQNNNDIISESQRWEIINAQAVPLVFNSLQLFLHMYYYTDWKTNIVLWIHPIGSQLKLNLKWVCDDRFLKTSRNTALLDAQDPSRRFYLRWYSTLMISAVVSYHIQTLSSARGLVTVDVFAFHEILYEHFCNW